VLRLAGTCDRYRDKTALDDLSAFRAIGPARLSSLLAVGDRHNVWVAFVDCTSRLMSDIN
jgi:hypothetical protein